MSDKRQVAELLVDLHHIGYAKGYAAGLDAAREAVAAVKGGYSVPLGASVGMVVDAMRWEMLAAIDELLKGERA